jgi:hypothetical protein
MVSGLGIVGFAVVWPEAHNSTEYKNSFADLVQTSSVVLIDENPEVEALRLYQFRR